MKSYTAAHNVIDGYDWTENPFREDPITHRSICLDCWNTSHGTRYEPGCKVHGCNCGCYEALRIRATENAAKAVRTKKRHEVLKSQLESESNPLRGYNPNFKGGAA